MTIKKTNKAAMIVLILGLSTIILPLYMTCILFSTRNSQKTAALPQNILLITPLGYSATASSLFILPDIFKAVQTFPCVERLHGHAFFHENSSLLHTDFFTTC